ncbi:tetratricopeptide repeat protein [Dapis sp. BLCC M229]|uniref:tetratricopeptide repeat protein n=1 Tax=Dapis sp. BLCC M229 TaxID=3400188 RepID=UPI003CE6CEF1
MTELLDKIKNQNNYDDLIVSIEASYRTLNILIAVCDNSEYREKIIQKYERELSPNIPCYRVELAKGEPSLRAAIASVVDTDEYLQAGKQAVITVTGVDGLRFLTFDGEKSEQEKFFGYLQWTREALRQFPFSIVLWVTFQMERNLSKKAPDFWAWRKGVFRFISFQKKALPREDVDFLRPVLGERLDEVDEDDPHFLPMADLQELIEKIEQEKGEQDVSLVTLYGSLGKIFARRVERGEYEGYQQEKEVAIKYFQKAIGLQQEWGLQEDLASNLNYLALLYKSQGRYEAAEPLYQQAIEIDKIALPENHPSLATYLNNLAGLYKSQGKYKAAEPLYKQAIEIDKIALPENHPSLAINLNNLAELYRLQDKYDEAEPLYKQAIEIYKDSLSPNTTPFNNLALLYYYQGRYSEAEPLYLQVIEIDQRSLPPDHPYLAIDLNNLALLYRDQGRYDEAEPLYLQAIEIDKRSLPPNHPDLASHIHCLAGLYYKQGRYSEAEPLYLQVIEIDKHSLPPNHPDLATDFNSLANLYCDQGRYSEAEPLYIEALDIRERRLGVEHPKTIKTRENLERCRQQQKS